MALSEDIRTLDIPCDERAPRLVRSGLRDMYDGSWSLDDGLLVASELVTNAVMHSGCSSDHLLEVSIRRADASLLISVHDPGLSGQAVEPTCAEGDEPGGWGLSIIEQLAQSWGAERPDGYRVWAELPADF